MLRTVDLKLRTCSTSLSLYHKVYSASSTLWYSHYLNLFYAYIPYSAAVALGLSIIFCKPLSMLATIPLSFCKFDISQEFTTNFDCVLAYIHDVLNHVCVLSTAAQDGDVILPSSPKVYRSLPTATGLLAGEWIWNRVSLITGETWKVL